MNRRLTIAACVWLCGGGAAFAQSCATYPNALTNGTPADATQVMANFNCAAVLGNARFTNAVGINNSTISTGVMLSITPTGNSWNEGIEINPSTSNGYADLTFRTMANSITGSWDLFMANTTDGTGSHSLGISMNGLTGMVGTGRVDTPFTIATTGVARFGAGVGIGTSDLDFAGTISSAFTVNGAGNTAIAAGYSPTVGAFALNPGPSGGWAIYDHGSGTWNLDLVAYNGNVVVGTGSASQRLVVNGNADVMANGGYLTEIPNASSTGTSLNRLAKLTGAPSTAVLAATTDTDGMIGVVVGGAGATGSAQVAVAAGVLRVRECDDRGRFRLDRVLHGGRLPRRRRIASWNRPVDRKGAGDGLGRIAGRGTAVHPLEHRQSGALREHPAIPSSPAQPSPINTPLTKVA